MNAREAEMTEIVEDLANDEETKAIEIISSDKNMNRTLNLIRRVVRDNWEGINIIQDKGRIYLIKNGEVKRSEAKPETLDLV